MATCSTRISLPTARSCMKRATREWVEKAESDYRLSAQTLAGPEPFHSHVCFLCQQAAEKYLKAVLEDVGTFVEKTHDLRKLRNALLRHYPRFPSLRRGLDLLNRFAVDVRYP